VNRARTDHTTVATEQAKSLDIGDWRYAGQNIDVQSGSDGFGPGFGIGGALAGLGGAGYLLKRRLEDEDSE